jgi:hypothetical protein
MERRVKRVVEADGFLSSRPAWSTK